MGGYVNAGDYYFDQQNPTDFLTGPNHFAVDDLLLDFPNDDDVIMNEAFYDTFTSNSNSNSADFSSSNSSVSGNDPQLSGNISSYSLSGGAELCVPYDDLAELEWLSSFTEESFSSDDLHNLQLISAVNKAPVTDTSSSGNTPVFQQKSNRITSSIFQNDVLVPGKVRSKRSRAAPCDWSSRLLLLKSTNSTVEINQPKTTPLKKPDGSSSGSENSVRRCLHCGSDKTPQWRRGPMGPKTLCNACGVRYKSGRLMPEYRPAASPTFVPAKHSNSHRKVMELRRQMELRNSQQQLVDYNSNFEGCNGGGDDYLIHRQIGPNYMHMI